MTSSTSIDLNLARREMVILGTQYAGEMKKGLFSVMHYLMPKRQILSLHSGCNMGKDGDVALFFGLSGIVSLDQVMVWLQLLPYDMCLKTLSRRPWELIKNCYRIRFGICPQERNSPSRLSLMSFYFQISFIIRYWKDNSIYGSQ